MKGEKFSTIPRYRSTPQPDPTFPSIKSPHYIFFLIYFTTISDYHWLCAEIYLIVINRTIAQHLRYSMGHM